MKKTVIASIVTFLLGIGLAVALIMNPFQWGWMHSLQHRLTPDAAEAVPEDGQLWTCGMHPQVIREEPGRCPICGMDLVPVRGTGAPQAAAPEGERKIKYWRAPMDPTYISDEPGKSPMGMDLIPVYEGEEEELPPGAIRINPTFVQNIGVQSELVERTDIPFTIRTVGTLKYDDSQISWITTKYEGWIESVAVNYVGEPVEKGQKLFEIYSPDLVTTQKDYSNALEYAERMESSEYPDIAKRARSLVDAARERLRYWDVSEEQIAELEAGGQPKRTLAVHAPVGGLIVEKMSPALEGMFVKPGMNLYKIADLSTIWAEVEVFENQIPWLSLGSPALIELPFQSGKTLTGRVRYIYPFFEEKTRTMKVTIELPNPRGELRADMYVNVVFDVPAATDVVAVPETAVIRTGQRDVVVLDLGGGRFQVKEVTLGVNGGGLYEIEEGVEAGDRIVVSSQFLIDSESNLQEAIRKLTAPGGAPAHER